MSSGEASARAERARIRPCGGRLQFSAACWETLLEFRQTHSEPEAGGILIGRRIQNSLDVIVDNVTIPGADDRRTRSSFFRSRRSHQRELDRAWRESGATSGYLGEWHSHPERQPHPSLIDYCGWARRLMDRVTEPLFFVIVGTEETRAWESQRRWALPRFVRLVPEREDPMSKSSPLGSSGR